MAVNTFMLIGNPEEGMNGELWESQYDSMLEFQRGYIDSVWGISSASKPGDFVVLLRTGQIKPGIIGFGQRLTGPPEMAGDRVEYPVRFFNVRSLADDPFISRKVLQEHGAWRRRRDGNGFVPYFASGTEITAELEQLKSCIKQILKLDLETLCTTKFSEQEVLEFKSSRSETPTAEADIVAEIETAIHLDQTTRELLLKVRRGQALFRASVYQREPSCRVTGVSVLAHLRASHIKPWRECNDIERLDGCNGLMLSPHIDHLFDQGFLTFEDDGRMLVSPELESTTIQLWHLRLPNDPRPFSERQRKYLKFHRERIFRKSAR